ncbi:DUF805 domain-containing protein [uncultured Duncaniella sp.]|uniref:DUF805 domain-containing protein n=1 Tax=uncultured Duncaniella sp. TaxID=2768039 RepID=UPI002677607D|nr:DUF805 domain-containing protein [uncultured Duncaniella sp.]MCI9173142.1 DUF805 domain-containing protein [Muribaculaceae bacterium]
MNITFGEAISRFYKKYADFNGRSTRAEYWYPCLYMLICYVILLCLGKTGMILYGIFALANIIPSLAVGIRRMHDIGKSGWWILINLVPVIGGIWFIVLAATPSKDIDNPYAFNK